MTDKAKPKGLSTALAAAGRRFVDYVTRGLIGPNFRADAFSFNGGGLRSFDLNRDGAGLRQIASSVEVSHVFETAPERSRAKRFVWTLYSSEEDNPVAKRETQTNRLHLLPGKAGLYVLVCHAYDAKGEILLSGATPLSCPLHFKIRLEEFIDEPVHEIFAKHWDLDSDDYLAFVFEYLRVSDHFLSGANVRFVLDEATQARIAKKHPGYRQTDPFDYPLDKLGAGIVLTPDAKGQITRAKPSQAERSALQAHARRSYQAYRKVLGVHADAKGKLHYPKQLTAIELIHGVANSEDLKTRKDTFVWEQNVRGVGPAPGKILEHVSFLRQHKAQLSTADRTLCKDLVTAKEAARLAAYRAPKGATDCPECVSCVEAMDARDGRTQASSDPKPQDTLAAIESVWGAKAMGKEPPKAKRRSSTLRLDSAANDKAVFSFVHDELVGSALILDEDFNIYRSPPICCAFVVEHDPGFVGPFEILALRRQMKAPSAKARSEAARAQILALARGGGMILAHEICHALGLSHIVEIDRSSVYVPKGDKGKRNIARIDALVAKTPRALMAPYPPKPYQDLYGIKLAKGVEVDASLRVLKTPERLAFEDTFAGDPSKMGVVVTTETFARLREVAPRL